MTAVGEFLARLGQLFNWVYLVMPWEQALLIRAGKNVTKIGCGIHVRIPFIDIVYKQSTRIRAVGLDSQTATTLDGVTITFSGSMRYRIENIEKMYRNVQNVQDTIRQEVQGIITQYFLTHESKECVPALIQKHTSDKLSFNNFGFADVEFFLKDFAIVKTYRFITGSFESRYAGGVDMISPCTPPTNY